MNRSIARPLIAPALAAAMGGLLLATALLSLPARAADPVTTLAVPVRVGDLDVNRAAGTAILHQRLRAAAQRVCGPREISGSRRPAAGSPGADGIPPGAR